MHEGNLLILYKDIDFLLSEYIESQSFVQLFV